MKRVLILLPALLLAVASRASAIVIGSAIADHAGSVVLDIQVDPNADPTFVIDQLSANVDLSNGAKIDSVTIDNGIAHIKAEGATPGSVVDANLSDEIALSTGVGPSPVGVETRRRAFWLFGGLGALAAGGGGGGGGAPASAPLAEEPPPSATPIPPPPPVPTPTSAPISPGP